MPALTPSERRGAMVVVLLLVIGAARDLWLAFHPQWTPAPAATPGIVHSGSGDSHGPGASERPRPSLDARSRPTAAQSVPSAPIDLNHASAVELDALPGIGPVLAGRIVEHRDRHGPFRAPDELLAVRGIGPNLLARLEPYLTTDSSRIRR
jgi:competence ComEA-like helix-hairpin-helix protein